MTFEEQVLQVMCDVENGVLHPDQAYFKMLDLHQEEVDRQLKAASEGCNECKRNLCRR